MATLMSHVPAQALPLLATERGAAPTGFPLWTTYWMLTPRTVPPWAFFPEALKTCVAPTSMDSVVLGLRLTLSTPPLPALPLLLPRQPERERTKASANGSRTARPQRCMNPPRVSSAVAGASLRWLNGKLSV